MSNVKKNMIEQAILRLGPGAYQNLMEDYLLKKHKYSNINALGTHTGTDKTTPGTPDTFVGLENGRFILINYGTVGQNSFAKIKADILACLDEEKTKIPVDSIEQIICCHTSTNLNPGQVRELLSLFANVELVGITTVAYDLMDKYQILAHKHLDIDVSTRQILNEEDFIAECNKNAYSTTLNMPLLCREEELETLISYIENETVVLVSGPSGIGKTRLAMEAARKYAEVHNAVLRFIKINDLPIHNDLSAEFSEDGEYVVVVDDANRLKQIQILLSMALDKTETRSIKLVLTTRDYTKEKLRKDLNDYCFPSELIVKSLSDDNISMILEENLNIKNYEYQQHICRLAKGNIRLAIMAGVRLIDGESTKLTNTFDIFRNYYSPIVDGFDKTELVVASIIAFYDAFMIDKDALPLKLAARFGISEEQFVDCCAVLERKEVIARREIKAVKFDNQNLQDYFLYYAFYDAKLISPSEIIRSSFARYRSRVVYTFSTLVNLFRTDELMEFLETEVKTAWAEIKNDGTLIEAFIEAFIYFIPDEALFHAQQKIMELPILQQDLTDYDFEKNANYEVIWSPIIERLADFRHSDYFSDAVDLAIICFERNNEQPMDFYHLIRNRWGFKRRSYFFEFADEHLLLDKLIENYRRKKSLPAAQLLYFALLEYTQYSFRDVEAGAGRSFTVFTSRLPASEVLISLREKCIAAIAELFAVPEFYKLAFSALQLGMHNPEPDDENDRIIAQHDIEALTRYVLPLIDSRQFEQCILLERYEKFCKMFGIAVPENVPKSEDNPVYALYTQLRKNWRYEEYDEKAYEDNIAKLAQNVEGAIIKKLWKELSGSHNSHRYGWELGEAIKRLFSYMKNQPEKLLDCFSSYAENGAPFCHQYYAFADSLIASLGWEQSLNLVMSLSFPQRNEFIAAIYDKADRAKFDVSSLNTIMEIASGASIGYRTAVNINSCSPGFLANYLQRLTECSENKPYVLLSFFGSMRREAEDAEEIISLLDGNVEILHSAVMSVIKHPHSDLYLLELLVHLVQQDLGFLGKVIRDLSSNRSIHDENLLFDRLWELDNYIDCITSAVNVLQERADELFFDDPLLEKLISVERSSTELRTKKLSWQRTYIADNCNNTERMKYLFRTLCEGDKDQFMDAILCFCENNKDYEAFESLYIIPLTTSWSGSEVPHIDREISFLAELKSALKGLNYVEHRMYIDSEIQSRRQYKEYRITREFLERY